MSDRRPDKREVDADEVIRRYAETVDQSEGAEEVAEQQADVPWHDQANEDTRPMPEAVVTGGDIDAAWDQAAVGDETVGGSSPTPDQDVVDEIGQALGVTYEDGEPLRPVEKLEQRDEERWELNPASSEGFAERTNALEHDQPPGPGEPSSEETSRQARPSKKAA